MFRPISICLGFRFNLSRKGSKFISFLSIASMIGIILGVAILITVLSVMNGFDAQIKKQFFAIAPQVTVVTNQKHMRDWHKLAAVVKQNPQVKALAPYVNGKGMLSFKGQVAAVQVLGVIPKQEEHISQIDTKMRNGSFTSLQPKRFNMVIGLKLAENLGVFVGDKIILLTPQTSTSPLGIAPRYRQFTVSGIFHAGSGFGLDGSVAYINYQDAKALFIGHSALHGLHVTVHDIYQAPQVARQLQEKLPLGVFVSNWSDQFGAFFHAIKMEKTMMFFILLLIIAVAAFNLVSGLVMVVNDKQADIAILRTLGLTRSRIMLSFIVQGAIIGLVGVILGILLGLLLAFNATAITNWIQHLFHVQFVSSSVYFINYLPSKVQLSDVVVVGVVAFIMTLLATIYPAIRAFKTQPAEALKYE